MPRFQLIAVLLFAQLGFGFQSDDAAKKAAANKSPVPTYRPEPKYTEEARAAHISGIVMLQLVVDEQGRPTEIEVLSPLGYGLDENAILAVTKWRFQPGTKDNKAVKVTGQVEVTFRLDNSTAIDKSEKQRAQYNVLVRAVQQGKENKSTADSLRSLASQKYPPGMYLYGKVLEEGRGVTADPDQGFRLIQESADKKYGPAIYEVAVERLQGGRLEKDPEKGMDLMRSAAKLGSRGAQEFLGQAYEKGSGVPVDLEKSRQYFRLCAADRDSLCQYRLGKSLLEHSDHPERDYVQAIAWLQLAANQGVEEAEKTLRQEDARLTPAQVSSAKQLMTQLVHTQ